MMASYTVSPLGVNHQIMCSAQTTTERLLLHTCCGPCATRVIELLTRNYQVTAFFFNPNIDPAEEYLRRFEALEHYCDKKSVECISETYDHLDWLRGVAGLEHQPEGGSRCEACFAMRLKRTALTAAERGFPVFGTTLSISPHKDTLVINRAGQQAAREYSVRFIEEDFKQDNGYRKSCELSRHYGLYRQKYCGCEFSKK